MHAPAAEIRLVTHAARCSSLVRQIDDTLYSDVAPTSEKRLGDGVSFLRYIGRCKLDFYVIFPSI